MDKRPRHYAIAYLAVKGALPRNGRRWLDARWSGGGWLENTYN